MDILKWLAADNAYLNPDSWKGFDQHELEVSSSPIHQTDFKLTGLAAIYHTTLENGCCFWISSLRNQLQLFVNIQSKFFWLA